MKHLLFILAILMLTGCGQYGKLYLPDSGKSSQVDEETFANDAT